MASREKFLFIPLKSFLLFLALFFAISATLLTILLSAASTATGSNPSSAITLTDGENTGVLGADQERWFRIIPGEQLHAPGSTRSLTLIYSASHQDPNQFVSMQIFNQDQIQYLDPEGHRQISSSGEGQLIPGQGEAMSQLVWTGPVADGELYYVQLLNGTDFPLEYWLVNEISSALPQIESEAAVPEPVALVTVGASPSNAATLSPGLSQDRLEPYTTRWYTFVQNDVSVADHFQDLNFSLFFTPGDGNRGHHINFELFTAGEISAWHRGDRGQPINFGAGRLVSRDSDPNTGERVWGGTLLRGDTYFVAVENGSDAAIDYWLFDEDIYDPQLGLAPQPAAAPVFVLGDTPQSALPLGEGQNVGGLDPAQEVWYSFTTTNSEADFFVERALTMVVTPDDGNRIHHVNFEVFTADGVRSWSPGGAAIYNVGAGGLVVRDNNLLTGERFWTGWLIEDMLFYVRIRNGSDARVDYWLFTGDVYGPELGQPAAAN
jgi:hypothetical protein